MPNSRDYDFVALKPTMSTIPRPQPPLTYWRSSVCRTSGRPESSRPGPAKADILKQPMEGVGTVCPFERLGEAKQTNQPVEEGGSTLGISRGWLF